MTCECYTILRAIKRDKSKNFSAGRAHLRSPARTSSCMRKVESFENQAEVARVDLKTRRIAGGKPERATLEAFVEQAVTAAREKQNLESIASPISEGEEMAGQRILLEHLAGQPCQAVESATQIHRRSGDKDPDARGDREHHRTAKRDRIDTASSTRDSPLRRRKTPLASSISIAAAAEPGRIVTSANRGPLST